MDLNDLNMTAFADKGAWFTPTHPATGEDLPMKIQLAGADSQRWQEEEKRYTDKRLKEINKRGKMLEMTSAEIEERGIHLLAAVTLGWQNIELDGQPAVFSEQNARVIYRKFKWLREQVDAFVSDRANFGDFGAKPLASVFDGEALIIAATENFPTGQDGDSVKVQSASS